jgi:hypothetical protein
LQTPSGTKNRISSTKEIRFFQKIGFLATKEIRFFQKIGFPATKEIRFFQKIGFPATKEIRFFQKIGFLATKEIRFFQKIGFLATKEIRFFQKIGFLAHMRRDWVIGAKLLRFPRLRVGTIKPAWRHGYNVTEQVANLLRQRTTLLIKRLQECKAYLARL